MSPAKLCPKHSKPFPCGRCRIENAQKPALTPAAVATGTQEPGAHKSESAIRAAKWREQQKQNSEFNAKEAKRKHRERKESKQDPLEWSKEHPEFPLDLNALRRQEDRGGVYMSGAPRGKGKLVRVGGSEQLETISGDQTADAAMSKLPLRAQFSDDELIEKLKTVGDLQTKIDLILEHWKHDEEFCAWLSELSLEEVTEFVQYCSASLEDARYLLYGHTEHQARAQILTHAQPHGTRVEPSGISDSHEGELPRETDNTFARRISFKKADIQTLRIGNRNVRFYNLQNYDAEQHFERFVRANSDPQPIRDEKSDLMMPDAPMMCKLCQREIAPGFIIGCVIAPRFSVDSGFEHFETEHRQEVIDHIRWWEAKAWRPKPRTKCSQDHDALAKKCYGLDKIYCRKCGKLLYNPVKPDPVVQRSDAPETPGADEVLAA
jgi:hypothetical protein